MINKMGLRRLVPRRGRCKYMTDGVLTGEASGCTRCGLTRVALTSFQSGLVFSFSEMETSFYQVPTEDQSQENWFMLLIVIRD